ncbi:MAG: NUDIX domain-containing protein [Alicyclobacillus sp.]|nr:NUDIX domain-containing protein [Alicyclobacillus sp.]
MSSEVIEYSSIVLPRLRYQYCPMCRMPLATAVINDDGIRRVLCTACGSVHYATNAMGVNVVIKVGEDGIVALLPPNEPKETPAALPSGHVEYGESPAEAAVREAKEETGLDVEVVRCLGWEFKRNSGYPGPMVSFFFETKAVGGRLVDSEEGRVRVYPINAFPDISPNRGGSLNAMRLFKATMQF